MVNSAIPCSVVVVYLVLSSAVASLAQTEESGDTTAKKVDFIFSLGGGVARFMGDVQDAPDRTNVHFLGNRAVFGFHFGAAVSKSFTVSTNMFYGKLSGNENTFGQHRNFESNMLLAGVVAEYNFAALYKGRLPVLNPFVNAGLYYGSYWNISTDLGKDDGTKYYYWSDGTIRDQEQTGVDVIDREAHHISRDFEYETKLVKGALHTFNIGAGFGLDLHISRAVTMRLMSRYFFATDDKIDGQYSGNAKGLNDGFFYNSLSLVLNAMAFSPNRKDEKPNYKYLFDVSQLKAVEQEDQDGDGVVDLKDRCAATPSGIEVDKEGCPLDKDVDGIPDYRDKNTASEKGEIVDKNGASIDYELVAKKWTDSPNIYGISWDKNYQNPRFREDLGYTVNVDIVEKDNQSPKIQKVLRIPELRKEILNDSLIVYRLGIYEKFDDVEVRRQQLVNDGIYSAYSVPENASLESVQQFTGLPSIQDEEMVNSYGVKESIRLIKTSSAYTFPQLDYTISRFERYLFDRVPEAALVEDYLQAISSFTWDEIVKRSSDTIYGRLEKNPVPGSIKRIESGLADEEIVAESKQESGQEPVLEVEQRVVEQMVETTIAKDTNVVRSGTVVEVAKEMEKETVGVQTERTIIRTEETEVVRETSVEAEAAKEIVVAPVEEKPAEPIVPVALIGEELQKAIEQIRATSNLNKQPRINYAPVKPQFKAADLNNDQLISAMEIQQVLDDILKGQSDFTEAQFNEMNAYFTDFTQNVEPIDFGGTKVAFVNGKLTILKTVGGEYEENSRRLLARKYKEADFNKDGELTPEEVQKMIDLFLKGGSSYSQEKVHELIDLFFD
ncbi:MAG: hypothetical protein H6601_10705 [Flavobacteriales bacterium]|nr:hypothetical protein [Flavobacteriales bacterium]